MAPDMAADYVECESRLARDTFFPSSLLHTHSLTYFPAHLPTFQLTYQLTYDVVLLVDALAVG